MTNYTLLTIFIFFLKVYFLNFSIPKLETHENNKKRESDWLTLKKIDLSVK